MVFGKVAEMETGLVGSIAPSVPLARHPFLDFLLLPPRAPFFAPQFKLIFRVHSPHRRFCALDLEDCRIV